MATLGALLRRPAIPPEKSAMPRVTADAMAVSGERGSVMAAVTVHAPLVAEPVAAGRYFRPHAAGEGGSRSEEAQMSGGTVVSTPEAGDADAAQLARFGYGQELRRVLNLFENFAVAFCYISPVVGIYSLFILGVGSGGPRYIWLLPIVVLGQLFVALVFAELGSHYPIAGALFQWGKNLIGPSYGWWVGWIYGWALIMTVASVDTGLIIYVGPLINNIFHTAINFADPNQILICTVLLILVQLGFNVGGVNFLGRISQIGVYFEIVGTFGIAIMLAITGFHHGFDYLFSTQGTETAATSPLGVDFGGNWWLGAAFVAVLAHVYIFYGFESAGHVAAEVGEGAKRGARATLAS